MNYESWYKAYKPIVNQFAAVERDEDTTRFETHGMEFEFLQQSDLKHVWTELDCGTILPGFKLVNRMNYYITSVPHDYVDIEVNP